jgi:hypothetical protein
MVTKEALTEFMMRRIRVAARKVYVGGIGQLHLSRKGRHSKMSLLRDNSFHSLFLHEALSLARRGALRVNTLLEVLRSELAKLPQADLQRLYELRFPKRPIPSPPNPDPLPEPLDTPPSSPRTLSATWSDATMEAVVAALLPSHWTLCRWLRKLSFR